MFIQEGNTKVKEMSAGNLTQVLREVLRGNKRSAVKTAASAEVCSEGGVLRAELRASLQLLRELLEILQVFRCWLSLVVPSSLI